MKRREFLQVSGTFAATAALTGIPAGCGGDDEDPDAGQAPDAAPADGGAPTGVHAFPQGVASGDPRQTSVVIWTRAVLADGSTDDVTLRAQMSTTEDFAALIVDQEVTATSASDHTIRLYVDGLTAKTTYYYRFVADDDVISGRTCTAPESDDTSAVRLAWVSCQDYQPGFYGSYRRMIIDDEAAGENDKIQFVVHLGDFIYETRNGRFQKALDDEFNYIELADQAGTPRMLEPFPTGGTVDGKNFADTLEDYRHLYKAFLTDPDLQAARARWPFICTWDNHEFTNDSWQTQANFTNDETLDEPSQTRKVAANQAWFEFIPSALTDAEGVPGVNPEAKDFTPAEVENVEYSEVDENNLVTEANNLAALDSIAIYRSFRWGKLLELVITDERSYRSDHAVPEEAFSHPAIFDPRNVLPIELVNEMDAGNTANDGSPRSVILGFQNSRAESPPGTMLGAQQKAWWKATMQGSDATWKIWGNEVPLMRFFIDNDAGALVWDRVMNADAWDGYNQERNELMQFLRDNEIANVLVITGDIHAQFAGTVLDDHDGAEPGTAVVPEFTAAGISSNSVFSFFEGATQTMPEAIRGLITYDSTGLGGDTKFANNLNVMLRYGSLSCVAASESHDIDEIEAARVDKANPHLLYADSDAQGYGIVTLTETGATVNLVTIERPIVDRGTDGPSVLRTATFTVAKTEAGQPPTIDGPQIDGELPWPLRES